MAAKIFNYLEEISGLGQTFQCPLCSLYDFCAACRGQIRAGASISPARGGYPGGTGWVPARRRGKCGTLDVRWGGSVGKVCHAPVAQLDRASDYGSEGREFESLLAYQ